MTKYICIIIFILCSFLTPLHARQTIVIKDSEIDYFLEELYTPVFQAAGIQNNQINVFVINDLTPNAFVSGGNNMFIHTGLLLFADSYEEVVGVIAHELGHITAGHLIRGYEAVAKANILMILGLAAALLAIPAAGGSSFDVVGFSAYSGQQVALASFLNYSRAEESQADQLAVNYLIDTPYSISGLVNFMNKLNEKNTGNTNNPAISWYTTHPSTKERLDFLVNSLKQENDKSINKKLQHQFEKIKAKIFAFSNSVHNVNNKYKNDSDISNYAKGIAYYNQSDYATALTFIEQIKNPDPFTKELKADIYYTNNNYNKSNEIYANLFLNNPTYLLSFKLARSLYASNNLDAAEQYLKISLQTNKSNPSAWRILSLIYGKQNKIGEANLALSEESLLLNNKPRAIDFAKKALPLLPKDSDEYYDAYTISIMSPK